MNKNGCHNKQCGMFTEMMPTTQNCAFVWLDGPKNGCDKYQDGSEAVVSLNNLLSACRKLIEIEGGLENVKGSREKQTVFDNAVFEVSLKTREYFGSST